MHPSNILGYSERSWYFHAAINPWLMGVLFFLSLVMIVYLYHALRCGGCFSAVK